MYVDTPNKSSSIIMHDISISDPRLIIYCLQTAESAKYRYFRPYVRTERTVKHHKFVPVHNQSIFVFKVFNLRGIKAFQRITQGGGAFYGFFLNGELLFAVAAAHAGDPRARYGYGADENNKPNPY
jgi:hypothetical protein